MPREGETAGERERRLRREGGGERRVGPAGRLTEVEDDGRGQRIFRGNDDDPYWPGPQDYYGQGPTPADMVARRGTREWKNALDPRRKWAVGELWDAHVGQGLNLSDKRAVSDFLRGLGIEDVQGGGRHLWNIIMGNRPEEGFGMNDDPRRQISWAMERYMPDWKVGMDQAVQGGHLTRDRATGLYVNPGRDPQNPEWYDSYGRRVPPPYAGPWKTAEELEREAADRAREAGAAGITYENANRGGQPVTPPPAAPPVNPPTTNNTPQTAAANRVVPAAITGYNTTSQQTSPPMGNTNRVPFYTSPTPPNAVGTSYNTVQQQPKKAKSTGQGGTGANQGPAAMGNVGTGWYSTWA